jgi:hypothetical protein
VNPLVIQMIVSVATILCSGVVSAVITHKLSAGLAEKEFRRKKLEELYFALHTYCGKLFSTNMVWPRVMRGEITYNDANDLIIKNHDKEDKSHDVAQMLVNIYFPQLRPQLEAIIQRRDRINQIRSAFKKAYERQENCDRFIKPFWDELSGIDSDEKAMTNALFRISEKYR